MMRLIQTVRHLKTRQILYRLYYSLKKPDNLVLPTPLPAIRPWMHPWNAPLVTKSAFTEDGQISLLNKTAVYSSSMDWNDTQQTKLWLYNLHYLDDLNAKDSDSRKSFLNQLIHDWIEANPPLKGVGWEPYVLSLRILNLVKWFSRHPELASEKSLSSLALQAEALYRRPEYHVAGNHLLVNGKALVFVGTYFEGKLAQKWLKKGLSILDAEITEQFLDDGAHFELSPMYHAFMLWDLLDIIHLAEMAGLPVLQERILYWKRMAQNAMQWFSTMLHPDEGLSFFNDAALNMAPSWTQIQQYAKQLALEFNPKPKPLSWLKDSGYCVVEPDSVCKALLDLARIGPDYQPGHAHADTLSFECSLFNQRFIVNSGTSRYGECEQRAFERSTKAHNTVVINETNSSEVWGGFRVARRAKVARRHFSEQDQEIVISADHTGYTRLSSVNVHRRTWQFSPGKLHIEDVILGGKFDKAQARFYFHPEIQLQKNDAGFDCIFPDGKVVNLTVEGHENIHLEKTFWYPEFGLAVPNSCLDIVFREKRLAIAITWSIP